MNESSGNNFDSDAGNRADGDPPPESQDALSTEVPGIVHLLDQVPAEEGGTVYPPPAGEARPDISDAAPFSEDMTNPTSEPMLLDVEAGAVCSAPGTIEDVGIVRQTDMPVLVADRPAMDLMTDNLPGSTEANPVALSDLAPSDSPPEITEGAPAVLSAPTTAEADLAAPTSSESADQFHPVDLLDPITPPVPPQGDLRIRRSHRLDASNQQIHWAKDGTSVSNAVKTVRDTLRSIENPDWEGKIGLGKSRTMSPTLPVGGRTVVGSGRLRPAFTSLMTQSFERSNPQLGKFGSTLLGYTFSPVGIFLVYRVIPVVYYVTAPMVVFCPGGTSYGATLCGEAGFEGLIGPYYVLSVLFMLFFGLSWIYVIFECSVFWIDYLQRVSNSESTRSFQRALRSMLNIQQQEHPRNDGTLSPLSASAPTDPVLPPKGLLLSFSGVTYYLLSPFFLLASELCLLVKYPHRLSAERFFGDYEIFRNFVFGSGMGLFGFVMGVLGFVAVGGFSLVGFLLIIASSILLTADILFVHQFSSDDGASLFSGFISCHYIPSHAPEMILDESGACEDIGDCPYYRTMRYREKLDFTREGKLKDFQIAQMVNIFKKHCQVTELQFSVDNRVSQSATALFCSCLVGGNMDSVLRVNQVDVKELVYTNQLIVSPDVVRVEHFFRPGGDADLVPWNEAISWKDGFWWSSGESGHPASAFKGFPFTVSLSLSLVDPFKLIEIDLGSNELKDEIVPQLTRVIAKSVNLVYVEIGGNCFSEKSLTLLGEAIANNTNIVFARMSTVLLRLDDIRDGKVVDLSLPKIYSYAIDRCVASLYDAVSEQPDNELLRGAFTTLSPPLNVAPHVLQNYLNRITQVLLSEYRFLSRDFYRSLPPGLHRLVIERVAKRLSKFAIDDPGQKLDLPGDRALQGSGLVTNHELLNERLYLSLLSKADVDLIADIVKNQNFVVEEVDFRGMPLLGENGYTILTALRDKPTIKSLNLTSCFITHPRATEEILTILERDYPALREMRLKGNPALKGQSQVIWEIVGSNGRQSHPDVAVDAGEKVKEQVLRAERPAFF